MKLGVGPGDRLAFSFDEGGALRVMPVREPQRPLCGFLAKEAAGRELDCRDIDEAIRERVRGKYGPSS